MLIGLDVGIGILGLIAIAAICCYACGKYRTQKANEESEEHINPDSNVGRHSNLPRISRLIPHRYPVRTNRDEYLLRQVLNHYCFAKAVYSLAKITTANCPSVSLSFRSSFRILSDISWS